MSAFWRALVLILIVIALGVLAGNLAAAQQPDEAVVARVLGPHWKHNARAAGMVFAGTVLSVKASALGRGVPAIQVKLRVDRAIAGVNAGQILTIREWTGALATRPPMRPGQHVLLLLYSPSWLGLTSPVGGVSGQIALDANGHVRRVWPSVSRTYDVAPVAAGLDERSGSAPRTSGNSASHEITVAQLERAIRRAREE